MWVRKHAFVQNGCTGCQESRTGSAEIRFLITEWLMLCTISVIFVALVNMGMCSKPETRSPMLSVSKDERR